MKATIVASSAVLATVVVVAATGQALVSSLFGGAQPSQEALSDIPRNYLTLYYEAAGNCPGLGWSVLAAIGKIESDHGRSRLVGVAEGTENYAGARGPMQFLQSTFDSVVVRHPLPAGGRTPPSPWDPHDAVHAAAHYLCDSGARDGRDLRAAIWAYNHADWYVAQVLAQADRYASAIGRGADRAPAAAAMLAINFAQGQLGLPYVWGGNGPDAGHAGFDCSGLTKAAYAAAGIEIPRTAQLQHDAGPSLPNGTVLRPGDLVFYGTPADVHHVGLYIGNGQMIHAPTFGQMVQIAPYRWPDDHYLGATRPTSNPVAGTRA
ncbi:bifunctional lytic transglycosylase/C40 family peptidase [Lentzea sp. NPDC006480]|uniref:C40 family peptidase n=1 Tax=Lentzea sp. NPDC006480 TaxID=3157176 RepID=UPI0033B5420F